MYNLVLEYGSTVTRWAAYFTNPQRIRWYACTNASTMQGVTAHLLKEAAIKH